MIGFNKRLAWGVILALGLTLLRVNHVLALEKDGDQESRLRDIKVEIEGLKVHLSESERRRNELLEELRLTESSIGMRTRRLVEISGQLEAKHAQLRSLESEKVQFEKGLEAQQRAISRQVRAAYAMGRQERLKILLNQQDPEIVSRMLVYYDYFNRARLERMTRIHELVKALEQTTERLQEQRQQLQTLSESELLEQAQLEETRQARQQVIAALGQEISDKTQRLSELERDERRLQDLVNKLHEANILQPLEQTGVQPFKSLKGKLDWPARGRLIAGFGQSRGGSIKWDGVMIAAPEGAEVRAVHRGRVAFADWLRGFGLLVIVDHGDGYMTLYGHNQSLFKEIGEWVEAGEPLALVGTTGGRTESGVYFGIRAKGKPVNPTRWCRRTDRGLIGLLNSAMPLAKRLGNHGSTMG
ncbi:MAG: peptidoglycan DD-metalloendopeptidase family protein [Gammaproteobacteria bacterium]|nr:peptidoglycan DD-metalloendopeptidase family protein [Gammaproteobacteria bacterium]